MSGELTPFELRIQAAVEEVIAPLVSEGRATLVMSSGNAHIGAIFQITPARPGACPLKIICDDPGFFTFVIGPHHLPCEQWMVKEWERGDCGAIEGVVREWLFAILAGRYEESVRLTSDGRAGKGRGRITLSDGCMRLSYSNVPSLFRRGPWQHTRYEPY